MSTTGNILTFGAKHVFLFTVFVGFLLYVTIFFLERYTMVSDDKRFANGPIMKKHTLQLMNRLPRLENSAQLNKARLEHKLESDEVSTNKFSRQKPTDLTDTNSNMTSDRGDVKYTLFGKKQASINTVNDAPKRIEITKAKTVSSFDLDGKMDVLDQSGTTEPEDLMKAGPFEFLPNYKNPCWLNPLRLKNKNSEPLVLCLPYFYLVGAPKSGTTDLNQRLIQHPQISSNVKKEPHWLTSNRYKNLPTLRDYQRRYFTAATNEIIKETDSLGIHNIVFGDCSASTLWDNCHTRVCKDFKNTIKQPNTNAEVLHHLNPNVKIIAILRNPVDRLYSENLYFQHDTPQAFHNKTVSSIAFLKRCFKERSMQHCIYAEVEYRPTRLGIGIYHLHLHEWFRVFPRDQIMIIKLEDFSKNTKRYMEKVFSFLDLAPIEDHILQTLSDPNIKANVRLVDDQRVGNMLPETRQIIQDFYRPFNDELVKLLGESFNYTHMFM